MVQGVSDRRPSIGAVTGRSATTEPATDSVLLARFTRDRDEEAFEELIRRHGPMVMGVCRCILHNSQDAEDAFQATFLVLAQKSARISRPELLGNWLYGVAYRIAKKAKRSQAKSIPMPASEPEAPLSGPDLAWKELQAILDEEMRRLPVRDRVLLTLCYFEGLTHLQVARRLGWRPGSVSRRLTKAREALRAGLKRRGLAYAMAGLLVVLSQSRASALSNALIRSTARASAMVAAGQTPFVSPRVAALTRTAPVVLPSLLAVVLASSLLLGPCDLLLEGVGDASQIATEQVADPKVAATDAEGSVFGASVAVESSGGRLFGSQHPNAAGTMGMCPSCR